MSLPTQSYNHTNKGGYQEVNLPDDLRDFIRRYIDQYLKHYNPYLCDSELINEFAIECINYLQELTIKKSCASEIQRLISLIRNSHLTGSLPVVFIRNTPSEPDDSFIEPSETRGFNYASDEKDRLKKYFYSEWVTWLVATLFNHEATSHPSEHGGSNRFHLISPIPSEDNRLREIGASTGGGKFYQHSDATVYTDIKTISDLEKRLYELNTDMPTVSSVLNKSESTVTSEVLCGKYTRVDATLLKGIINLKTKTFIGTPELLEKSLIRDGFQKKDLEKLSNMPIAHIAGPADGIISGYVGEINRPIYLGDNNNIIGSCLNASINRMIYVGRDLEDKALFERFLQTLRTMEVLEFLLTPSDLLFIPNSHYRNQSNFTHGRGKLDDSEYKVPIGDGKFTRRMLCRQYASSKLRDGYAGLLTEHINGF